MKYLYSFIVLCAFTLSSCYEDSFVEETTTSTFETERVFLSQITGTIVDTSGLVLSSAVVTISEMSTMTDQDGRFILFDVPIQDNGSVISASKSGYIDNAIRIYKKGSLSHDVTIVLIPESISLEIDGSTGGIVRDVSGVSLNIQARNFLRDGIPYESEVFIQIYWVDIDKNAPYPKGHMISEVVEDSIEPTPFNILSSSSMAYITVLDENGNKLEVDPDMPILVTFPVNEVAQLDAPQTDQKLLSYDPDIGFWKEEGSANYDGLNFIAEVTHFSWWSIGTKSNAAEYCYEFIGDQTEISNSLLYTLTKTDGTIVQVGSIKLNDQECLFTESDVQLELKVYSSCFKKVYVQTINPKQVSGTDLINLEIDNQALVITGKIKNCNREIISDSVQIVYSTELSQDMLGIIQGDFTINLDACFSSEFIFVSALKEGIVQGSAEIEVVDGQSEYSIDLILCSTASNFGTLVLDDQVYGDVIARQNPEETLIIAGDKTEPQIVLAFDGFGVGSFDARLIDNQANFCDGTVEITEYGEIGDVIIGTYISNSDDTSGNCAYRAGSFTAIREK